MCILDWLMSRRDFLKYRCWPSNCIEVRSVWLQDQSIILQRCNDKRWHMYACRALAEEDYSENSSNSIQSSLGDDASALYTRGSAVSTSMPSLDAWLTKEGCMFPDTMERLVHGHLSRGDQMSAMIASEWWESPLSSIYRCQPLRVLFQILKHIIIIVRQLCGLVFSINWSEYSSGHFHFKQTWNYFTFPPSKLDTLTACLIFISMALHI